MVGGANSRPEQLTKLQPKRRLLRVIQTRKDLVSEIDRDDRKRSLITLGASQLSVDKVHNRAWTETCRSRFVHVVSVGSTDRRPNDRVGVTTKSTESNQDRSVDAYRTGKGGRAEDIHGRKPQNRVDHRSDDTNRKTAHHPADDNGDQHQEQHEGGRYLRTVESTNELQRQYQPKDNRHSGDEDPVVNGEGARVFVRHTLQVTGRVPQVGDHPIRKAQRLACPLLWAFAQTVAHAPRHPCQADGMASRARATISSLFLVSAPCLALGFFPSGGLSHPVTCRAAFGEMFTMFREGDSKFTVSSAKVIDRDASPSETCDGMDLGLEVTPLRQSKIRVLLPLTNRSTLDVDASVQVRVDRRSTYLRFGRVPSGATMTKTFVLALKDGETNIDARLFVGR